MSAVVRMLLIHILIFRQRIQGWWLMSRWQMERLCMWCTITCVWISSLMDRLVSCFFLTASRSTRGRMVIPYTAKPQTGGNNRRNDYLLIKCYHKVLSMTGLWIEGLKASISTGNNKPNRKMRKPEQLFCIQAHGSATGRTSWRCTITLIKSDDTLWP